MPAAWSGPRYTIKQLKSTGIKSGSVDMKLLTGPLLDSYCRVGALGFAVGLGFPAAAATPKPRKFPKTRRVGGLHYEKSDIMNADHQCCHNLAFIQHQAHPQIITIYHRKFYWKIFGFLNLSLLG